MPYAMGMPEGFREMILHLIRTDDEVKQAILDLIRREGEKHQRRGDRQDNVSARPPHRLSSRRANTHRDSSLEPEEFDRRRES